MIKCHLNIIKTKGYRRPTSGVVSFELTCDKVKEEPLTITFYDAAVYSRSVKSHHPQYLHKVCTSYRCSRDGYVVIIYLESLKPQWKESVDVSDIIRDVRDPEKPETLEELSVISEEGVHVSRLQGGQLLVKLTFVPTVPHCSLASLIGRPSCCYSDFIPSLSDLAA